MGSMTTGRSNQERMAPSQTAFSIRKADLRDVSAIHRCLTAAFSRYRDVYTPGAYEDTVPGKKLIQARMNQMRLFAAVSDGEIVGTVGYSVEGQAGYLRGMAVVPAWQGRGVASALLNTAEAELVMQGCDSVWLDTTQPLRQAIRFYESKGFAATGRVSDFFGMPLYEYVKTL